MTSVDFMAIGAHPDDIELGCGATVARMIHQGHSGVFLDMTRGELGTRGTPELRRTEAVQAASILGIQERIQLNGRDGFLQPHDPSLIQELVATFRQWRPRTLFVHPANDRHPDHVATCALVLDASFKSGLRNYPAPGEPWRPRRIFHYAGARSSEPDFCVDVTDFWDVRKRALAAFASQFSPDSSTIQTPLTSTAFQQGLDSRAQYLGSRIRTQFAEGFWCSELPEIVDPCALSDQEF